jgi:hypothetical protein
MARRRTLCNYANASNETARPDAIYQRGQYYIVERNKRRGDRRRYAAFLNDDMIAMGGSLVRVKRFINDMYNEYPFETEVNEGLEKVKRFARRAQMQLRTELKPSRTNTGKTSGRRSSPGSSRKSSTGKRAAATTDKPIGQKGRPSPTGKISASDWKKYKDESARARRRNEVAKLERINAELAPRREQKPQAIPRLIKQNQDVIDSLRGPQQGRLF